VDPVQVGLVQIGLVQIGLINEAITRCGARLAPFQGDLHLGDYWGLESARV
jgi:hypothetical protein